MNPDDLDALTKLLQLGNGGIILAAIWAVNKVLQTIAKLDDRIDSHDSRLSNIEGRLRVSTETRATDNVGTDPLAFTRRRR